MRQLRKLHLLLAILAATLASAPSRADNGGQAQSAARKRVTCDLQVSQSVSADPVTTGFAFEFYVIVLNLGANATDAVIRDSIPGNTAFQYAFSTRGSVVDSSGTLVCSLGTLAPGDSAVVTLGLFPFAAGTVTNTASGATTILDANYANNVSTRSVTVQDPQGADVYLNLRRSPDSPIAGEPVTYTFNIGNAGPLAATDVTVGPQIFGVPFTVLSAIPSRGTCGTDSGGSVTCLLGTVDPGDSVLVSVVVVPDASGWLYAYPYVSSPTPDQNYGNNNGYDQVFVQPSAQLLIANLISQVQSYQLRKGTEQNLVSPLQSAAAALSARDTSTACSALGDFVRRVSVFAGRGLTVDQAFQLDNAAGNIESQLQCGAPRSAVANITRLGAAPVEFSLRTVSRPGDATRLRFALPVAGRVRLDVFDVGGRRVRTAFEGELAAGVHMMDWDGRGDGAGPAAPGVYFLRATMGGQGAVARVLLLR